MLACSQLVVGWGTASDGLTRKDPFLGQEDMEVFFLDKNVYLMVSLSFHLSTVGLAFIVATIIALRRQGLCQRPDFERESAMTSSPVASLSSFAKLSRIAASFMDWNAMLPRFMGSVLFFSLSSPRPTLLVSLFSQMCTMLPCRGFLFFLFFLGHFFFYMYLALSEDHTCHSFYYIIKSATSLFSFIIMVLVYSALLVSPRGLV